MTDDVLMKWSLKIEDLLDRYRTKRFRDEIFEEASLPFRFEGDGAVQWFTEFKVPGRTVTCAFSTANLERINARLRDAQTGNVEETEWGARDFEDAAAVIWGFLMSERVDSQNISAVADD